ncbi:MAG: hypothetical protein IJW70_10320 [Clostridia bacterium]|nr:hypothetical protein [Clostridia bacterium]
MQQYIEDSATNVLISTLLQKKEDMFTQGEIMHRLCTQYGFSQSKLSKILGVSQSCVGNKIRLLHFSAQERAAITRHNLSERHARALLRISSPKRVKLIETAGQMHLTVQQTEQLVEKYRNDATVLPSIPASDSVSIPTIDKFSEYISENTDRLRNLGYKVSCLSESGERWRKFTILICE